MTEEDIIRMAREAGCEETWGMDAFRFTIEELERFAALVAEAERKAICELADDMLRTLDALPLIDAIEARGQTKVDVDK